MKESVQTAGGPPPGTPSSGSRPDSAYLRLLLFLLGTATFFEGYDSAIAGIVLNDLRQDFHATTGTLSWVVLVVGSGAFLSLFVTALGDRIGRRPLLIGTTLGYALFTGLTATATSAWIFVVYQFLARAFLIGELGVALTMVAEEFPPERRGRAVALLTAFGGFGLVAVAVLYRFAALGWRGLYLVGVVPLLLVGLLRFKLRETGAWLEARREGIVSERVPFRDVLAGPHRREMILVSAAAFFIHFAMIAATYWFVLFAQQERGLSRGDVSTYVAIGFPLGIAGYFVAGWLSDRFGRRRTGVAFMLAGVVCGIALYQTTNRSQMFVSLVLSVFFGVGITPILGAVITELFPTEIRATAVALARSVFGTLGATVGPFVAGQLADPRHGVVGSLGDGVSLVILAYLPAALLLWRLPETMGRDLTHLDRPPRESGQSGATTAGQRGA
jgi:MFS transporter, putative metabolite:H+ symporter